MLLFIMRSESFSLRFKVQSLLAVQIGRVPTSYFVGIQRRNQRFKVFKRLQEYKNLPFLWYKFLSIWRRWFLPSNHKNQIVFLHSCNGISLSIRALQWTKEWSRQIDKTMESFYVGQKNLLNQIIEMFGNDDAWGFSFWVCSSTFLQTH